MGEIKGQILGILAVITVFGTVSAALYAAFQTSAENVSNKITAETSKEAANKHLVQNELLRF